MMIKMKISQTQMRQAASPLLLDAGASNKLSPNHKKKNY
jgi:hypothetical protein